MSFHEFHSSKHVIVIVVLFTTLAPSEQYIRSMRDYKSSYFVYAMLTELLRFIILRWMRMQFY